MRHKLGACQLPPAPASRHASKRSTPTQASRSPARSGSYVERERLRPGDRIGTEHELAREFGVSRPTLREGLRRLDGSHLIRVQKGRAGGVFVENTPGAGIGRHVSESIAAMLESESVTLCELLEARMFLEVPLAGLAAQLADAATVAALVGGDRRRERPRSGQRRVPPGRRSLSPDDRDRCRQRATGHFHQLDPRRAPAVVDRACRARRRWGGDHRAAPSDLASDPAPSAHRGRAGHTPAHRVHAGRAAVGGW